MELIGRVILMAICVLTAYALPTLSSANIEEENIVLRALVSQLQSSLVNPVAINNSQDICIQGYNKNISNINLQTANQTQVCYKSAKNAFQTYDNQVLNMTVAEVSVFAKNLQMSLANCSAKNSNKAILDCYVQSFDQNLGNLYNLTSKAQLVASSVHDYEYEVGVATKMCVNEVLISSKINSTATTYSLQTCLSSTNVGGIDDSKAGNKSKVLNLN